MLSVVMLSVDMKAEGYIFIVIQSILLLLLCIVMYVWRQAVCPQHFTGPCTIKLFTVVIYGFS